MNTFPWKLEINRAATQYSTTKVVPNRKDLVFQDQTTETKMLQQLYFTIYTIRQKSKFAVSIPALHMPGIQAYVFNAFDSKQDAATHKKKEKREESKEVMK